MTTSVSRRLNILCILFKIIAFFITILFARRGYMWGWHFTHMWKAFAWPHHFTKRGDFVHKTNLTLPLFIAVPVQSQSCVCVLGVLILFLSTIVLCLILKLVRQCGTFLFFIFFISKVQQKIYFYFSALCSKGWHIRMSILMACRSQKL